MDAELKAKWVKALRSRKYKQATGRLRNRRNAHCCLGVLCDLVRPEDWRRTEAGPGKWVWEHAGSGALPDYSFLEQVGLTSSDAGALADMNDNGATFRKIAGHIEKNL